MSQINPSRFEPMPQRLDTLSTASGLEPIAPQNTRTLTRAVL